MAGTRDAVLSQRFGRLSVSAGSRSHDGTGTGDRPVPWGVGALIGLHGFCRLRTFPTAGRARSLAATRNSRVRDERYGTREAIEWLRESSRFVEFAKSAARAGAELSRDSESRGDRFRPALGAIVAPASAAGRLRAVSTGGSGDGVRQEVRAGSAAARFLDRPRTGNRRDGFGRLRPRAPFRRSLGSIRNSKLSVASRACILALHSPSRRIQAVLEGGTAVTGLGRVLRSACARTAVCWAAARALRASGCGLTSRHGTGRPKERLGTRGAAGPPGRRSQRRTVDLKRPGGPGLAVDPRPVPCR